MILIKQKHLKVVKKQNYINLLMEFKIKMYFNTFLFIGNYKLPINKKMQPVGIEPALQESESCVLSIRLRLQISVACATFQVLSIIFFFSTLVSVAYYPCHVNERLVLIIEIYMLFFLIRKGLFTLFLQKVLLLYSIHFPWYISIPMK